MTTCEVCPSGEREGCELPLRLIFGAERVSPLISVAGLALKDKVL
jgi:hypothetical protein